MRRNAPSSILRKRLAKLAAAVGGTSSTRKAQVQGNLAVERTFCPLKTYILQAVCWTCVLTCILGMTFTEMRPVGVTTSTMRL